MKNKSIYLTDEGDVLSITDKDNGQYKISFKGKTVKLNKKALLGLSELLELFYDMEN